VGGLARPLPTQFPAASALHCGRPITRCLLVILLQPPCYSSLINALLPQLSTTWYSTERACISAESVVAQHISLSSSGGWDLAKGVRTSGPLHYHSYLCCNITLTHTWAAFTLARPTQPAVRQSEQRLSASRQHARCGARLHTAFKSRSAGQQACQRRRHRCGDTLALRLSAAALPAAPPPRFASRHRLSWCASSNPPCCC